MVKNMPLIGSNVKERGENEGLRVIILISRIKWIFRSAMFIESVKERRERAIKIIEGGVKCNFIIGATIKMLGVGVV